MCMHSLSQMVFQGAGPSLQVGQEAAPQTVALLRGNDQPRAYCLLNPKEEHTEAAALELSFI